jgi:hypothetical protein
MNNQRTDNLCYEDIDFAIKSFPLESLGSNWSRIDAGWGIGFKFSRFGLMSTACWRGYVVSWEISNNRSYMVGFETIQMCGNHLSIKGVFETDRLLAFWFTGEISSGGDEDVTASTNLPRSLTMCCRFALAARNCAYRVTITRLGFGAAVTTGRLLTD